jgi:hypothetical protein
VLDGEDLPVALPFVRLHAQVGGAEAGQQRHLGRREKIPAVEDGGFDLDEHARLVARRLRWRHIGQKNIDDLLECVFLPFQDQLREEVHQLVNHPFGSRALFVVGKGDPPPSAAT